MSGGDRHPFGARQPLDLAAPSRNCARHEPSAQIAPIGSRAAPVNPASDTRKMNFSQIGTRPSSTASAWMSAPARALAAMRADAIGQPRKRAEHLAEDDAAVGAGLLDDPGRGERGRDVGRAAEHAAPRRRLRELR